MNPEQKPTAESVKVARSIVREWVSKSRLDKEIVETVVSTHQQSLLTISFATALAVRDGEIERLRQSLEDAEKAEQEIEELRGYLKLYESSDSIVSDDIDNWHKERDNLQAENQQQRALLVEACKVIETIDVYAAPIAQEFLCRPAVVELLKEAQ
jgi:hypothetical protein